MIRKWLCLAMVCGWCVGPLPSVEAQWSTAEKGTALGAIAGGGAGAAIGRKSGNPVVGAIVGGLGGAIVGQALGEGIEQRRAVDDYYRQQSAWQQPVVPMNTGVSLDQVIQLTRGGLGDELIISHIEQNGFRQRLSANDLIVLKQQGVSDRVIHALQRMPSSAAPPPYAAPAVRYAPPVTVVEEIHMVPAWHGPTYYYPRPLPVMGHPHYHRYRSSSTNFHLRF